MMLLTSYLEADLGCYARRINSLNCRLVITSCFTHINMMLRRSSLDSLDSSISCNVLVSLIIFYCITKRYTRSLRLEASCCLVCNCQQGRVCFRLARITHCGYCFASLRLLSLPPAYAPLRSSNLKI